MKTTFYTGFSSAATIAAILFLASATTASAQQRVQLEPGDVVLSANGERIYDKNDLVDAVARSGDVMTLTVRDRRSGSVISLSTRLSSRGQRFGVYCTDHHGEGARITSIVRGSAATRCVKDGTVSQSNTVTIPKNLKPGTNEFSDGTVIQVTPLPGYRTKNNRPNNYWRGLRRGTNFLPDGTVIQVD